MGALQEGGITFISLEGLRLPQGCDPPACDALLCPAPRDGYPSRLFLSVKVKSPYRLIRDRTIAGDDAVGR